MIKIYSSTGASKGITIRKFDYMDTFMGERQIDVTLNVHTPLNLTPGDYVTYRGENFTMEQMPSVKKTSTDDFTYTMRFVSYKYELERCQMRDLVPYDNGVVYPTPLSIEFTGTVNYLTERIQACLDAMYGKNTWKITIGNRGEDIERSITLQSTSCWNALSMVYSEYKLYYYISGRNITVTADKGATISRHLEYGYDKGLYSLTRNADTDTGVVTKLRAYGGTRNLDFSYPKQPDYSGSVLPANYVLYPLRLMLPSFKTDGVTDYIMASSEALNLYGIREATITYDDIYPSITGATNSLGQRIDQLAAVTPVTDEKKATFTVTTRRMDFKKPDGTVMDFKEDLLTSETPQLVFKSGTLQGYAFNITDAITYSTGSYFLTLERGTLSDSGEDYYVPNKDWNASAGDEFVLIGIQMPVKYVLDAEQRLLARAQEYLSQYSKTNFSYTVNISEAWMEKYGMQNISAGMVMIVDDAQMGWNGVEILVQSVTVREGQDLTTLPKYEVTLNNSPSANILERIQGQVDSLEGAINLSFSSQQGINAQYHKKLDKSVWDTVWEIREDAAGAKYLYGKLPMATAAGVTMYSDKPILVPSIFEGLPLDEQTLSWENGRLTVIGGGGGGDGTVKGVIVNDVKINPDSEGYVTIPKTKWDGIDGMPDSIKNIDTTLAEKVNVTTNVIAGAGLTGGGALSSSVTLSLAPSGVTAGSYFKTTVDTYGRVTAGSNPTTLAGYGITDAKIAGGVITLGTSTITPLTVTDAASTYVKKAGDVMTGDLRITKNNANYGSKLSLGDDGHVYLFEDKDDHLTIYSRLGISLSTNDQGITVDGVSIKSLSNNILQIDGDLLVTGNMTFFAQGGRTASTIMDGVAVDGVTIVKENNRLVVVGGGGGGAMTVKLGSVAYNSVEGVVSLPAYPTTLPASDVYAWAKASSKPSYTFSEITSKPTTLSGYGITDGFKAVALSSTEIPTGTLVFQGGFLNTVGGYASFVQNGYGGQFMFNGENCKYRYLNNGSPWEWRTVFTTYNYQSLIDRRYVLKSGDTMTGSLILTGGENGRKVTLSNSGSLQLQGANGGWASGLYYTHYNGNAIGYAAGAYGTANALGYYFYGGAYNAPTMVIHPNGYVGIGISSSTPSVRLHVSGEIRATEGIEGQNIYANQGYAGSSWNSGAGAFNVKVTNNSNQTPLLVAYRNTVTSDTGANRLFAMELLNSGTTLRFCMGGSTKMTMLSNGNVGIGTENPVVRLQLKGDFGADYYMLKDSSTNAYLKLVCGSRNWYVQVRNDYMYVGNGIANSIRLDAVGNLLSPQGITMYSDIRKKNIGAPVVLSPEQIANAPLFHYTYKNSDDNTDRVGTSAQYWRDVLPQVTGIGEDSFYTLDPATLAVASSISLAKAFMKLLREVKHLKKELKKLQNEKDTYK